MTTVQYNSVNRSTGPSVYNYPGVAHNNNNSSGVYVEDELHNNVRPNQNAFSQQPLQQNLDRPSQNVIHTSNASKGSRAQEFGVKERRFEDYRKNDYKYNLFSLIDEPYNRCLQVGKCGSCPGNQCIARQVRNGQWKWI